jgi:hypothetical protein
LLASFVDAIYVDGARGGTYFPAPWALNTVTPKRLDDISNWVDLGYEYDPFGKCTIPEGG